MASPNDNVQLRDGLDAVYKLRTKDVSAASDGSLQIIRHFSTPYPIDYGIGGCFQLTSASGTMAAGLAAVAPIYAFRWVSASLLGLVRRVRVSVWSLGTGFTAGVMTFSLYRVSSWTVADTGGTTDTLTGDNGNLRTAMPASALTEIRHSATATLTAGTRTVDAQAVDTLVLTAATTANTVITSRTHIFDKAGANDHPLVLAQNQGFVIAATVPATGTWSFTVTPEWDEVPLVNY